ncbi:SDR family oxidoreductase [Bermanella marisrubri]|uniref:ActC family protein n=1 Tax=Bermanella marisrubri TaxID=207949 RepID=Q1N408_9GAMM|nr:SDR family oxidoreductase [Bermanella marisrubri]EAT13057.1 ActC family protein [Oceanobacter sp. RED65] [Bermanella marisrubri]QIZ82826.1 SDR family oxidoreductase [Bermanella marisrubri]
MARFLIVGSGDIGGGLARSLKQQGHDVWGMRRSEKSIGEGIHTISADVSDMETLIGILPERIDYVVYCVASPEFSEEGYDKYYVMGLRHILALLKQNHESPKRIFFVSSTSVYPHHDGAVVNEETELEPTAFAGRKMLEAESTLLHSDFTGTVVRFSGIYGPGRTRLINQAKKGAHCDPEPDVWTNRIHRDDCIGVLSFLIEQDEKGTALDSVYLASDPTPTPIFEVFEWLKDRIGDVEPDHDVPEVTRRGSKRCDSSRLVKLGYRFKYKDYQQGYDEILTEMGY